MSRGWIDEGLRQQRAREDEQRLASERRHEHAAVIKEKAPDLMRRLVAEVAAAVAEYRERARVGSDEIEFEELPHEGFSLRKTTFPRVALVCRPGYETHMVYCNRTRVDGHESDVQEFVFNLDIAVDDSNHVALRHETVQFSSVGPAVEFLLKPVLFPTFDSDQ
jgi:hypothetical protein